MRMFSFESVTDCDTIFDCGENVIFAGKHPWIFRKDGTYIAKIKSICRAWNMLSLSNGTVFMDGHGDKSYHHISPENGEVLWSLPKKGKRNLTPRRMSLSPNGRTVYYLYSIGSDFLVDTIIPDEQVCLTKRIPLGKGPVHSFFCNSDGNLVIMQCEINAAHIDGFCTYTLLIFDPTDMTPVAQPLHFPIEAVSVPVEANEHYALFSDLRVLDIQSGLIFSLLDDHLQKISKDLFTISGYDEMRQLLNIRYIGSGSTLIIDCNEHRIAAHYRPISEGLSSGSLIGDEFWLGSSTGIVKLPFPYMDPFPHAFFEKR